MTPYETAEFCRAAIERETADYKRGIWAAWHIASFTRRKKLPKLSDILKSFDAKPVAIKPQSAENIVAKIMVLQSAFRGKVKR